jgi:hypothetical protein
MALRFEEDDLSDFRVCEENLDFDYSQGRKEKSSSFLTRHASPAQTTLGSGVGFLAGPASTAWNSASENVISRSKHSGSRQL